MDAHKLAEDFPLVLEWGLKLGTALVIFFFGWIFSKWAYALILRALRQTHLDEALARFLSSVAQWLVLAVAVIASLAEVGVETTSLAAVLGATGVAIGLALQGSLSHFASGVLLLVFRPFTLGDRVTAAGMSGKVEDIGLFATTLSTPANERIILPNAMVTGDAITNHTASGEIRSTIEVGVAYGSDIAEVCKLLLEVATSCDLVLEEPGPSVAFVEMAASSLNFRLFCWAEPASNFAMQHQVRAAVYDRLNEAGIEIPFDQLVVHKAP